MKNKVCYGNFKMNRKMVMKRKLISIGLVIVMILGLFALSGCNSKEEIKVQENNPQTVSMNKNIENTAEIHIVDVIDNFWSENLDINLTQEETEQFVKYLCSTQGENKKIGWKPDYKLQCIDKEGKLIMEFGMAYNMFTDYNGVTYYKSDEMMQYVDTIEKKYKLTSLDGRIAEPGESFFYFLDKCTEGVFEKDFGLHEGKTYMYYENIYNITKEDIEELVKLINDIELNPSENSDLPGDSDHIYLIYNDENEDHVMYNFIICENGDIYCNGYKITGRGIEQWMEYLDEKYK